MNDTHKNKEELADTLLTQIQNIANGNHIKGSEINKKSSDTFDLDLSIIFSWQFFGEKAITRQAGGKPSRNHMKLAKFDEFTKELIDIAERDKKIRKDFLNTLQSSTLNSETIQNYNSRHIIWESDEFSTEEKCCECKGNGKVQCQCYPRGQIKCSQCNGLGKTSLGNKWTKCTKCSGAGSIVCPTCRGKTYVTCKDCKGYGFFGIYGIVKSIAEPTWHAECKCNKYENKLESFLNACSVEFIVEKISFDYKKSQTLSHIEEEFIYQAQSVMTELIFNILDKDYTCVAFLTNPPLAFLKPPFFDDLFSNEISYLKNISSKNISKIKALDFFEEYRKQPTLDKSLKDIAKMENRENYKNAVINACEGYISQESASLFSNLIEKCLDKLSPTNSPLTWLLGLILGIIPIFFGTEAITEISSNPFSDSIFLLLGGAVGLGFVLLFFSIGITKYKQTLLPKEYRQPMKHSKVFFKHLFFCSLAWLSGIAYGFFAQDNQSLQLHKYTAELIQAYAPNICQLNENFTSLCKIQTQNK